MCIFRLAAVSDRGAIVDLVNRAYRPRGTQAGWTHESALVEGDRIHAGQLTEILARPDSHVLVGVIQGVIVSCVHVERVASSCCVGMLAVCPAEQGRGLGARSLAEAERWSLARFNVRLFTMTVISERPELVHFYVRRGYRRTGVLVEYPLAAGVGEPKGIQLRLERLEKIIERG